MSLNFLFWCDFIFFFFFFFLSFSMTFAVLSTFSTCTLELNLSELSTAKCLNRKYKNLIWLWGADWKFRHEGNCLASWGLPSDAKQLPEWLNFQSVPHNHYGFFFLHTLPSTLAFRLEYVLFYQCYDKIATFFDQEKFGMAPLLYVDVEIFRENWRANDINTSKMTSKRQNRRTDIMHESRLKPSCKTTFLNPGQVHANPGRVCKNRWSDYFLYSERF